MSYIKFEWAEIRCKAVSSQNGTWNKVLASLLNLLLRRTNASRSIQGEIYEYAFWPLAWIQGWSDSRPGCISHWNNHPVFTKQMNGGPYVRNR
jgi:hypothetical protein